MRNQTRQLVHQKSMSREAEQALLQKAQNDDREAFRALWEPNAAIVKAFLFKLGCKPDDLDDLVSECALRALKNIRKFKATCSFSSWLCRLAVSARADLFRQIIGRNKDRVPRETLNLEDAAVAGHENLRKSSFEQESGRRLFLQKLDKRLTPRELAVTDHLKEGLDAEEIAAEMKIGVSKVYYALNRVKKKAKQILMERKSEQPKAPRNNAGSKFTSAGT